MADPKYIILLYRQIKAGKKGTTIITNLQGLKIEMDEQIHVNKNKLKYLIKSMHDETCKDIVRKSYVNSQLNKNQIYLILFDNSDNSIENHILRGKPVGFILGHTNYRDDNNNYLKEAYLDVICAIPGTGRYLLQYFIDFAKTNRYKAVSLKAIPTVLTYYPKFGFKHRHTCKRSDNGIVPPTELYDEKYRDPKYKEIDNIYDDENYFKYQMKLRKNGFGDFADECAKKKMTKEEFGDNDCGAEGYMMRKCL
jgi:hypothetical protein